jgi:hypothetical protein
MSAGPPDQIEKECGFDFLLAFYTNNCGPDQTVPLIGLDQESDIVSAGKTVPNND